MSKTSGARQRLMWSPTNAICPFLYHTQSIQQSSLVGRQSRFVLSSKRCYHGTPRRPSEIQRRQSNLSQFFKEEALSAEQQQKPRRSTITQAEQDAFEKVMKLFTPGTPETDEAKATSADNNDVGYSNILDMFKSFEAQRNSQTSEYVAAEYLQSLSLDDPSTASSLRADAAAELVRTDAGRNLQTLEDHELEVTAQLQNAATAAAVMEEISKSFDRALQSHSPAPDIALWRVCEECVFPLISLLNIKPFRLSDVPDQLTPSDPPIEIESQNEFENDTTIVDKNIATPIDEPSQSALPFRIASLIQQDTPVLPLLTQIYPAACLLAMRLFLLHHPSSPFALALLPRIRRLGPTSYVLGVNAPFYNALISLRWDVYSDMRSIDTLLLEMQHGGIEADASTHAALDRVKHDRGQDLGRTQESHWREPGARSLDWWNRREQRKWYTRVMERKWAIGSRLGAQSRRETFEDREKDRDLLGEREGGWSEFPAPKVWNT